MFPDMDDAAFAELCASIAKHGIRQPVYVHKGKIVDGRHRERAGLLLGCHIPYVEWEGGDDEAALIEFVADCNLNRRDLTVSQRAAVSVEIKTRLQEIYDKRRLGNLKWGGKNPHSRVVKIDNSGNNARAEAALKAGVSAGYVYDAEKIRKASSQTFEEVKQGRKTLQQAKRELAENAKPENIDPSLFDSECMEPDPLTVFSEKCIADLTAMRKKFKQFSGTDDVVSRIDSLVLAVKILEV